MAKQTVKLVKVQILKTVSWKSKILSKSTLHEMSEEDAQILIDKELAEIYVAPKAPQVET
jgi:hypothetical protein